MKSTRRVLIWVLGTVGVLFLAIQFVPVDRSNPAIETEVPASAEVRSVLKRACYDCHSNEVVYPWYSYVAPVSWLVAKDVREGREKLNFSAWNRMSAEDQAEGPKESWEKVQEGEMPLWFYLPLHPSANLTPADKALLQAWAGSASSGSGTGGTESGTGAGTGATIGTGTGTTTGAGSGSGTDADGDSDDSQ
jgi:hypothetical protein